MRKTLFFASLLLFLCSCDKNKHSDFSGIKSSETFTRDGFLYQKGETSPYSGYIMGERGAVWEYDKGKVVTKYSFHENGNIREKYCYTRSGDKTETTIYDLSGNVIEKKSY